MPFEAVVKPIPGQEAFSLSGDPAILSQAALLLLIGAKLRGDEDALLARARAANTGQWVESTPADEIAELALPTLPAFPGGKIDPLHLRDGLRRRYGEKIPGEVLAGSEPIISSDVLADLCDRFYRQPGLLSALELMEACLRHPEELPRIAAAIAYFERTSESERLLKILERGTYSEEPLVRDIAATGLAHAAPQHGRLSELQSKGGGRARRAGAHTTLLIHGTWARHSMWWQPTGDFHSYLTDLLPTLSRTPPWSSPYRADDRFDWSGGYSDEARSIAADDLLAWVNDHAAQGLDLITHSHGGSVAMLANKRGLQIGELVLLSCPVHVDKYLPDFNMVRKVVSIRVHLDLVILADRGGQRFRSLPIEEHVLPLWFDHTDTHKPEVWQNSNYKVQSML